MYISNFEKGVGDSGGGFTKCIGDEIPPGGASTCEEVGDALEKSARVERDRQDQRQGQNDQDQIDAGHAEKSLRVTTACPRQRGFTR